MKKAFLGKFICLSVRNCALDFPNIYQSLLLGESPTNKITTQIKMTKFKL